MTTKEVPCADCEYDESEERYCLLCPVLREKREWRKNPKQEFPTNEKESMMTEQETRDRIKLLQAQINELRAMGRGAYNEGNFKDGFKFKNPWIEANKLEEELKNLLFESQIDNRGITNF